MRREKKPFQEKKKKKSKDVHKATAPFGQREPCVSPRRASATALRRREREKKNPLIHLSFLAPGHNVIFFFHVYSPVGNIRER